MMDGFNQIQASPVPCMRHHHLFGFWTPLTEILQLPSLPQARTYFAMATLGSTLDREVEDLTDKFARLRINDQALNPPAPHGSIELSTSPGPASCSQGLLATRDVPCTVISHRRREEGQLLQLSKHEPTATCKCISVAPETCVD